VHSHLEGTLVKTQKTRFTIGRERTCDVPIADDSVSRLHAEISILEGGKYFLTDCHSSNGTMLHRGGTPKRISQETVFLSDKVQFGDVTLSVSDIVDSIKARSPKVEMKPPVSDSRPPAGSKVIRCECGAIKPEGRRCPACGA
jgi:pSer/pThr/pTyr-binding forkhead associated (FHA) protein